MSKTPPATRTRAQLSADFRELDTLYSDLFNRCTREQLVWRPPGGSWSIAECIEHVDRGNTQYLPPIRAAIDKGGPPAPRENYLLRPGGWFSAAFLKRIGPQVTIKFKAPPKIRPQSVEPEQAFQELRRGHAEIQELLAATARLDLNRIFVSRTRFCHSYGSPWRRACS